MDKYWDVKYRDFREDVQPETPTHNQHNLTQSYLNTHISSISAQCTLLITISESSRGH